MIFRNQFNEITEGAISNIFIKKGERYWTPPVSAGLLAGTHRRYFMEHGNPPVEERSLYEEDLRSADALFVSNAIRGLVRATLSKI